jgi:hypothetical protein
MGFCGGLALVRKGSWQEAGKYGFIDTTGQVAIPVEYDFAGIDGLSDPATGETLYPLGRIRKGGSDGLFKNPYYQPKPEDVPEILPSEGAKTAAGAERGEKDNPEKTTPAQPAPAQPSVKEKPSASEKEKPGGSYALPVAAVAVAALVGGLLALKKKRG